MFVFATETCAACPLHSQCRPALATPAGGAPHRPPGAIGHSPGALLRRTKTLFQVCLAAAVANLTLGAVTADAPSASASVAVGWSLMVLAAILSLSRFFGAFRVLLSASTAPRTTISPFLPSVRSSVL
jgi:hypothetical protein